MFQIPNQNPSSKLLNFLMPEKIFLSKPQKYSKYQNNSSCKAQIFFKTQIVNWKIFCQIWDPPCNLLLKLSEKFRGSYDDFQFWNF